MRLSAGGTWCIQGLRYLEVISYGYDKEGVLTNMVCIGWSGDQDFQSWRAETPSPILLDYTDIRRVFAHYQYVLPCQDSERAADRS